MMLPIDEGTSSPADEVQELLLLFRKQMDRSELYWRTAASPRLALLDSVVMCRNAHNIENARAVFDQEMASVNTVLRLMRARRNELAPVFALPTEIMAEIFALLATVDVPRCYRHLHVRQYRLGWVNVTHVCRRWRALALDLPRLWTSISFALGRKWAEVFLARSRTAPVFIHRALDSSVASVQETAALVEAHLSHIKTVSFLGSAGGLAPVLAVLKQPAPLLESIRLTSVASDGTFTAIPAEVFEASPALRTILLCGMQFSWGALAASGLVELKMTSCHSSHDKLVESLAAMPNLEVLILHDCHPSDSQPLHHPVRLARLRRFGVAGAVLGVWNLLANIRMPPTTKLSVSMSSRSINDVPEECFAVLPLIAAHVNRTTDTAPLRTVCVKSHFHRPEFGLYTRAWSDSQDTPTYRFDKVPELELQIVWEAQDNRATMRVLQEQLRILPLAKHVEKLSVYVESVLWEPACWFQMLGHAQNVQYVRASGIAAVCLSQAISEPVSARPSPDSKGHAPMGLLFPKMVGLGFYKVMVDAWSPTGTRGLFFNEQLPKWLARRAEQSAGEGLELVCITLCAIKRSWIDGLRRVAREVDWDGKEGRLRNLDEGDGGDERDDGEDDGNSSCFGDNFYD